MINKELKQRRVQRRLKIQLLPGNRGSHNGKNSGADHRANTECCERERPQRLLEARLRILGVRDQFVNGLLREELIGGCGNEEAPSQRLRGWAWTRKVTAAQNRDGCNSIRYRLATPRVIFFTFFFFSPRAPVRFGFAGAFLRAVRFNFLRSSFDNVFVFAMISLFELDSQSLAVWF